MKQSEQSVCLVIGASHAGSLLVVQLRKEGWQGRIILIGAESHLPYHRPPLSKAVLAGERSLENILLRPEMLYSNNQIELRLGERVVSLDRAAKRVQLASGEALSYDKLALCTGASPRVLPMANDLPGVFTLRQADDVMAIRQAMASGKRAVVIGGGYIGLEVAAVMSEQGLQVTVVEASERLLQRDIGEVGAFGSEVAHRHPAGEQRRLVLAVVDERGDQRRLLRVRGVPHPCGAPDLDVPGGKVRPVADGLIRLL